MIPTMCAQLPPPPSDERKKVVEDVDRDRRYSIDAAIVRTMKSRKVLQHTQASIPLPFWSLLIIACCCLGYGMFCNLGSSGWGSLYKTWALLRCLEHIGGGAGYAEYCPQSWLVPYCHAQCNHR